MKVSASIQKRKPVFGCCRWGVIGNEHRLSEKWKPILAVGGV